MKVLVIGLGSMGRRRIRLIRRYDSSIVIVGTDRQEERCQKAAAEFFIQTEQEISRALSKASFDCAFVSTSPLSHSSVIEECLKAGLHVFTEINLVSDGYRENQRLAEEKKKVLFLSSTFLYREEVRYIKERVDKSSTPLHYLYHVGQYLPDWHPWEDYRSFFVADKRTNGCRELFAIELPWLTEVFGEIEQVMVLKGKSSSLALDYPDHYQVLLRHSKGFQGSLCIDLLARKAVRDFEVLGEELYVKWDGTPGGLKDYSLKDREFRPVQVYERVDKLTGYSDNIIENAYFGEVTSFFEAVAGKRKPEYSFEKDEKLLSWIDRIEKEEAD